MSRSFLSPLALLTLLGCGQPAATPEAATTAATTAAPAAPGAPISEDDKTFYALGLSIGASVDVFKMTPAELSQVVAGLTDHVTGQSPKCDLEVYGPKLSELAQSREFAAAGAEKEKGKAFLAEAAKAPGAEVLPSGVVFLSETAGTGESPATSDVVKVHYRGTLTDGTEFDSSYKRNEPATFPLGGVIPCWTQGLQHMKVGGKAKLTCPSEAAYGDNGSPPVIPGGATLQFEVELLEIVKAS